MQCAATLLQPSRPAVPNLTPDGESPPAVGVCSPQPCPLAALPAGDVPALAVERVEPAAAAFQLAGARQRAVLVNA